MQKEVESQLKRINKQVEEFELSKEKELDELQVWKDEQIMLIQKEKEQVQRDKEVIFSLKDSMTT